VRWSPVWELVSWSKSKSSVVEYQPAGNDVSAEAEESPLLEAVTKKRLVETVRD
jgi:hypothetical protein